MATLHSPSTYHVGDRVRIDLGRYKLIGVIVEDRGAIGAHGRHLYQVQVPMDPFEPMIMELPQDEIEAMPADTLATRTLDKESVLRYLASGGLISILQSNLSGGKHQPRAWLCLDNLGNVTHTFIPERGMLGGQVVPFSAVHDDNIFTPKRDAVSSFIESFGLNRQEAEGIVAEVGTAP